MPFGAAGRVVVALVALASLVIAVSTCQAAKRSVLPRPASGQAIAAYLDDGRPVFVVGHKDGRISVLDAFSTHVAYGVHVLIGWCPLRRTFHDPRAGGGWDEWGALRGGPSPTGLGSFSWEPELGDEGQAAGIAVTGFAGTVPGRAEPDGRPPFEGCSFETWDYHAFEGEVAMTPADAVASRARGWVLVRGRIDFANRQLCSDDAECLEPADILDLRSPGADPNVAEIQRPWDYLARVGDGGLVELTVVIRKAAA